MTSTLSAPGANVLGVVPNVYTTADTGTTIDPDGFHYMQNVSGVLAPADNRLWIMAPEDREREVIFETGGIGGISLRNCANITLWGLTGNSVTNTSAPKPGAVFRNRSGNNMHFIRMLVSRANLGRNQTCFSNASAQWSYYEECEAYRFYRHGFSFQLATHFHVRRCYANPRSSVASSGNPDHAAGSVWREGVNGYRARYGLIENCILEGQAGHPIQCEHYLDETRGHHMLFIGGLAYGSSRLFPTFYRKSGTHYGVVFKHYVVVGASMGDSRVGALDQQYGTDFGRFQNITVANVDEGGAMRGDVGIHNGKGAEEYEAIAGEAPVTWRVQHKNHVIWGNPFAYWERGNAGLQRSLSHCLLYDNGGTDAWSGDPNDMSSLKLTDAALVANVFTDSLNTDPEWGTFGTGTGKTLAFVPHSHPTLAGAGDGTGIDGNMGATVLYRHEGSLKAGGMATENWTSAPLWHPTTGHFPFGKVVAGYNDMDSAGDYNQNRSAFNFHERIGMSDSTVLAAAYPS